MKKGLIIVGIFIFILACKGPQKTGVCTAECDVAGDERENHELVCLQMKNNKIENSTDGKIIFPLRIGVVQKPEPDSNITEISIRRTVDILNKAFDAADIQFYITSIDLIPSTFEIEDLQKKDYELYNKFSEEHDLKDTISLYVFNYNEILCETNNNVISCSRTGGFSYILSRKTNNVVISKFDLEDNKIVVHEFGHFFGLYHTFESAAFGKELISGEKCRETGDQVCDTPADPGPLYEVYVNYSKCEMLGYYDEGQEGEYKPIISNFMAYYKPCYLKPYDFTPEQLQFIKAAALSDLRRNFMKQ